MVSGCFWETCSISSLILGRIAAAKPPPKDLGIDLVQFWDQFLDSRLWAHLILCFPSLFQSLLEAAPLGCRSSVCCWQTGGTRRDSDTRGTRAGALGPSWAYHACVLTRNQSPRPVPAHPPVPGTPHSPGIPRGVLAGSPPPDVCPRTPFPPVSRLGNPHPGVCPGIPPVSRPGNSPRSHRAHVSRSRRGAPT